MQTRDWSSRYYNSGQKATCKGFDLVCEKINALVLQLPSDLRQPKNFDALRFGIDREVDNKTRAQPNVRLPAQEQTKLKHDTSIR